MKLKLFTVTMLGLAVATTVALSGCKSEQSETTVTPTEPAAQVETTTPAEGTATTTDEHGAATTTETTSTTTEVPATETTTETTTHAPAAGEHGAAEHHE